MDLLIQPSTLTGEIFALPSKSLLHRALLCAALAEGTSRIEPVVWGKDILATSSALTALGSHIKQDEDTLSVKGIPALTYPDPIRLDCSESASTLRFLLPVMAALGIPASFYGHGRLPHRPLTDLAEALTKNGVSLRLFNDANGKIADCAGQLKSGVYALPGHISSQYISGLLFALPLLDGDSRIILTTPLESEGYVNLTLETLHTAGISVSKLSDGWLIPGRQHYLPAHFEIEGDYSAAAFWLAAGALSGTVNVTGLSPSSHQGDREILRLLREFGATIYWEGSDIRATYHSLHGCTIDACQIPDLVPVAAAVAAVADGATQITGAERLRLKESDRLDAVEQSLRALGAQIYQTQDGLCIQGQAQLAGGATVPCFGDHRIAMAVAIAALRCGQDVILLGADCVEKSYPDFFLHYTMLGGKCHVL